MKLARGCGWHKGHLSDAPGMETCTTLGLINAEQAGRLKEAPAPSNHNKTRACALIEQADAIIHTSANPG